MHRFSWARLVAVGALAIGVLFPSTSLALASGGGSGTVTKVDSIKVDKAYYDAPTGEGLIKASSSDASAQLSAYLPDGTLYGAVQNGGGSRYGGTVMRWLPKDPGSITIRSSSGGSITVPTTPFQP